MFLPVGKVGIGKAGWVEMAERKVRSGLDDTTRTLEDWLMVDIQNSSE